MLQRCASVTDDSPTDSPADWAEKARPECRPEHLRPGLKSKKKCLSSSERCSIDQSMGISVKSVKVNEFFIVCLDRRLVRLGGRFDRLFANHRMPKRVTGFNNKSGGPGQKRGSEVFSDFLRFSQIILQDRQSIGLPVHNRRLTLCVNQSTSDVKPLGLKNRKRHTIGGNAVAEAERFLADESACRCW